MFPPKPELAMTRSPTAKMKLTGMPCAPPGFPMTSTVPSTSSTGFPPTPFTSSSNPAACAVQPSAQSLSSGCLSSRSTHAHFSPDMATKSIAYLQQLLEESIKHSLAVANRVSQLETEAVVMQGRTDFLMAQQELVFQRSPLDRDAITALDHQYQARIKQVEDAFIDSENQRKLTCRRNALTAQRLEEVAALSSGAPEPIRAFLHLQAAVLRHESESLAQLPCLQAFLDASPGNYPGSLATAMESMGLRPPEVKRKASLSAPLEEPVLKWCSDVFSQSTTIGSAESLNMAREIETLKEKLQCARMAQADTASELQHELERSKSKPSMVSKEVQTKVAFSRPITLQEKEKEKGKDALELEMLRRHTRDWRQKLHSRGSDSIETQKRLRKERWDAKHGMDSLVREG